jgi:hypothetical protein
MRYFADSRGDSSCFFLPAIGNVRTSLTMQLTPPFRSRQGRKCLGCRSFFSRLSWPSCATFRTSAARPESCAKSRVPWRPREQCGVAHVGSRSRCAPERLAVVSLNRNRVSQHVQSAWRDPCCILVSGILQRRSENRYKAVSLSSQGPRTMDTCIGHRGHLASGS